MHLGVKTIWICSQSDDKHKIIITNAHTLELTEKQTLHPQPVV